jgi:L-alanine-DL-glutamate epimerase-like enolase superfamily enzyme
MRVGIEVLRARLRAPFVTGWGAIDARELLLLTLEDSEGRTGYGEAAPLEPYDGISLDDVRSSLEDCRATLTRARILERVELLAQCAQLSVVPHALAAVDLALWDLAGREAGQPVWRLLGASAAEAVEVNYTIGASDRAGAAAEAGRARAAGFGCVKVKVGIGDDAGRVAAVRAAAGPELAIRLDANGAWSHDEALAGLRVLAPAGIELCEEPVAGFEAIEQLAGLTSVPLSLDESAHLAGALDRCRCEAVCLKVGLCGGITGLLETTRRARSAGYDVYVASALDGPLGIAAALHAAAAIAPRRPCGLATLRMFDGRPDLLAAEGGRIKLPDGPGLGDGLVRWYRR